MIAGTDRAFLGRDDGGMPASLEGWSRHLPTKP